MKMRVGTFSLWLAVTALAAGCQGMSSEEETNSESMRTSSARGAYAQCAEMTGQERMDCERQAASGTSTASDPAAGTQSGGADTASGQQSGTSPVVGTATSTTQGTADSQPDEEDTPLNNETEQGEMDSQGQ